MNEISTIWRDRLEERFTALIRRAAEERANLSPSRKIEAEALALTQAELREVSAILLAMDNEGLA
jgi:hypothetical protein